MSIETLRRLAEKSLPHTVYGINEVDIVRVLRAAGLVVALFVKRPVGEDQEHVYSARILAITVEGRAALAAQEDADRRQ